MLDIRTIRERTEAVRKACEQRGETVDIDNILGIDAKRRALIAEVELLKNRRNRESREIGALKKSGQETRDKQAAVRASGERIGRLDSERRNTERELEENMLLIPNLPHPSVPIGLDESAKRIVRVVGEPAKFDFIPRDHVEIGERLGMLDFARAARMTGTGFPLYIDRGARLERALIQFMLDLHTLEHGYTELSPPFLCNEAAMTGTGQLPKMAEDMYRIEGGLYLIPTAEVPVTNFYCDEIIERPLPIRFVAYTPCFRREAGAAGKETRGLLRVHQFDKVELVRFVEPASSYDELEQLLTDAEQVLKRLGLAYRVALLCTGDLSFAATKCYDIEVWSPARADWLEVSSCSNFEAFQARRAGIRYRRADGKVDFVHTLNASGVALARLVVALLENCQDADGSVALPEALVPYMGGIKRLEPEQE